MKEAEIGVLQHKPPDAGGGEGGFSPRGFQGSPALLHLDLTLLSCRTMGE